MIVKWNWLTLPATISRLLIWVRWELIRYLNTRKVLSFCVLMRLLFLTDSNTERLSRKCFLLFLKRYLPIILMTGEDTSTLILQLFMNQVLIQRSLISLQSFTKRLRRILSTESISFSRNLVWKIMWLRMLKL